ncbi:polycystic kidney disease protein 1-like 2 [Stylophora pistillata]|nr:polycystic kidney disease protein 1-like 2 [Stylophora pistillata]
MRELRLQKRALPLGLFRLSLSVNMIGEGLDDFFAVVEGYIKTKQSPLTAEISGGSEIRRTSGSTVSLDALGSHDPDIGPGDHSGMRFFWLCRNISERFPDLLEDFINGFNGTAEYPISNRSSRSSVSSEQGCYRNGEYVISNRSHLNLTTVLMATNETYKIVLVVRKDSRTSSTSQLLELSVEDIPELTIRCVVNCHKKVNPSEKLTVSSECSGNACNAKLTYSWSLLYMESDEDTNSTWKTNNSLMKSRHISPHGSFPIIVIKKNVLQGNRRYKLTVKGNLPSGSYGLASHVFEVNAPPRDGTCDVEPRVGHVLTTRYRLWCTGWHDPDGPLKYEIYHVRGKEESPLQYGGNAATIITLPLGDGDNYTINITVRISDRLGAASSVRLQLQSLPPLLKGAQLMNQLSDLILDTNQDMLRNAMSISSVLNHQAGKDTPELSKQRKKIRELLIFALVKETTPSKQAVQLLSASLQEATQVTSEVSYEAQEAVTSALDKMATVFESESLETDSNSLETTAAGMTGTIGNLLDVASENAAVHQPNSTIQTSSENVEEPADNETVPSKSEVLVNKLFNVVDSLSTSVLRTKVSYEEATEIISPRLALNLKSTSPSDTGGNVNTGFASFNVPKGKDLLRNARPGLTSVNQKVMYTPKNYHTYHNSSRDISTPVVSLSYEDKEKKELITVSNLKKYIEYFLPAPDVLPGPNTYSVNVKAQDTWAYHKLVVSSKDEAVSIEVTPFNCSHKLQLHVQENRHPTKDKFSWRKEIWLSATDVPSNTSYSACFKDYSDYTLFIPNARLKQSTYFVGVLYSNGKEDIRSSNETAVMKYSIRVYKSKCLYWNQRQLAWMGDGCFVGPFTSPKQIHCMTNHLTSFGSGMFVAPNPIDFRKALAGFADAFQSGNVVVMFTIITLLMLYLVLAIWAWRVDRKDAMQIGATILPPSRPNSHYLYEVYVVTGSRNGSGTTAHVGCEIFGEDDDSGPCYLLDANRPLFRRGDLNVFILSVPSSFGVIRGIRIWHDNGGYSPSWFLCRAMLRDCQTDEKWVFLAGPAGRWLDVAEEDGKIDILLKPASELDMVSFKKLFNTKIRKGICDNHLWFSVAYRPPRSPFTRLQRLSCCLSLLFSFMVTTAMFYGSGPLPGDTSSSVQFGPIKLNMRTVIIGIESALIAIPVNILIVAFFRNSKAKGDRIKENKCCHGENDSQASEQETETDSINSDMHNLTSRMEKNMDLDDIQCHIGGEDDFQYGIKADKTGSKRKESFASNEETESIDDESLQNPQNPGFLGKLRGKFQSLGGPCFPHWCVYVGWVLCILTVSLSSVFTLFYSMMWGKEQSNMWLTTMAISFIQDTLISQPLKVLIVALIFAVFFKSADDDDHFEESQSAAEVPDEEDIHQELTNEELAQYDPPPKKILKILRIKEIRRREIVKLFTDICLYVILLAMVMILSFQYRNPASYKMINTLRRVFVDPMHNSSRVRFEQVNGVSSVWDWTRQTLLPGLFPDQIYKGLLSEPYMADRMSLQLGVARLRQVRIRKGTCTVNRWFNETFPQCNGFYSMLKEDTKSYESHWENATVKPKNNNKRNLFSFSSGMSDHSQTSWQHMDNFAAHHALPVIGKFATYSGGGYVIILNQSTDTSQEQMHWLDSRSRALHAEFVAYNPSINMVGAVTITFELPPLGGVFKSFEVFTVSMYGSLRKHPAARIIGEVIAAVVLIFMIYRVVLAIFHDKCQYFRDASKILDLVFVLTGMVIVFLKVLKEGFKMRATDQFKEDPKQFLDFHQCGFYDELTDYAFALLNFIAIVRFSFFLKFLGCLEHILSTIANCFYELFACLVVFFCLMMAFTSLFSIAFRGESDDFKDFSSSLQTSISYMARMVRSKEAMTSHTVVRAVALFSCCVTLIFFYLTVIRSVFIVGYRKTLTEDRGKEKEKSFESGIFEVFKDKFRELAGIEKEKEVIVQEEEDIHEVRLNALTNYFNKSQFFRLRLLLNEVYTDDFAEDLSLFDVVPLKQKPRHYIREDTGVQEDHRLKKGETFKPSTEIKQDPISENMQNKSERKSHVTFDLPVEDDRATTRNPTFNEEGELGGDTVPRDNNSEMPNEIEKLNVLEKLVEEKIRGLQKRQEDSTLPSGSGSVEKEIQMLLRLQQRIDEARITGPPSTQPSQEKLTKD